MPRKRAEKKSIRQARPENRSAAADQDHRTDSFASEVDRFISSYGTLDTDDTLPERPTQADEKQAPRIPDGLQIVGTGLLVQAGALAGALLLATGLLLAWTQGRITDETLFRSWPLLVICAVVFTGGEAAGMTAPKSSHAVSLSAGTLVCTVLYAAVLIAQRLAGSATWMMVVLTDLTELVLLSARFVFSGLFLMQIARYAQQKANETRAAFVIPGIPLVLIIMTAWSWWGPTVTEQTGRTSRLLIRSIQGGIVLTGAAAAVLYLTILITLGRNLRRRP